MREFEITNFKGEATDRNNWTKEQCQICKNFDLREVKGRLTSRLGYRQKYDVPAYSGDLSNISILRAENTVMTAGGLEEECTVLVGTGTLSAVSGSSPTPSSLNIGLFFIRPYYNGSSWVDAWQWLNECYLTTISNQGVGASDKNQFDLYGDWDSSLDAGYFAKFSIYSKDKDVYSEIYKSLYVSSTVTEIKLMTDPDNDYTVIANGDSVLVMKNFIPYDDLQEYYNVNVADISFHKILTDLRIGFGGEENRLGLMVGYRKKQFQLTVSAPQPLLTDITNVSIYDEIILAPYNILTEDTKESSSWATGKAFHLTGHTVATNGPPAGRYWFKLTAVLDDYQEFLLPIEMYSSSDINVKGSVIYLIDISGTPLSKPTLNFRFHWGLFNKRITKIKVYCSGENPADPTPQYPYYLIDEWDLSEESGTNSTLTMNDYGFLCAVNEVSLNNSRWEAKGAEIDDELGYLNTLNYARGWDHAVAAKGYTFFSNAYVDKRYNNWVLFSPYSGAPAPQYDVAVLTKYMDFENHDGNLTKGIGILPNLDIAAFKANSFQRGNTVGQVSTDLYPGTGIDTRRSLVNLNSGIALCSQQDIYITDGAQRRNISAGGISDTFRAMTGRTNIFAVREEKEDAYRFRYLTTNQYLYAMGEWVKIVTSLTPTDFITSKDGTVWFLSGLGAIYNQSGHYDVNDTDTGQAIALQWKSIEFDIAKMGGSLTANTRLYVLSVFMKYSSTADITVNVYRDGALFQALTFASANTYDNKMTKHGCTGKTIEIEIVCNAAAAAAAATVIESIGFYWEPRSYREYV